MLSLTGLTNRLSSVRGLLRAPVEVAPSAAGPAGITERHTMAGASGGAHRIVRCCACARPFPVPAAAVVLTCPKCNHRARVDDVVIHGQEEHIKLETCGRIFIRTRGSLTVRSLIAGMGVEVLGSVQAGTLRCGKLHLGPRASVRGDCTAGAVHLDETATLGGGMLRIDPSMLGKAKD